METLQRWKGWSSACVPMKEVAACEHSPSPATQMPYNHKEVARSRAAQATKAGRRPSPQSFFYFQFLRV